MKEIGVTEEVTETVGMEEIVVIVKAETEEIVIEVFVVMIDVIEVLEVIEID